MNAKFQNRGEPDLFEQFQSTEKKTLKKPRFNLPYLKKSITLTYENIIFLVMGLIISCVIFFSLGVEKGRQDIARVNIKDKKEEELVDFSRNIEAGEQKTEDREVRREGYVIQLAAFKTQESAEREQGSLKESGYDACIKKSGDYYQLYVGRIDSMEKAQNLQRRLKEKYKDCYIKSQ